MQRDLDRCETVYVVYGQNQALHDEMNVFLRALGLQPIEKGLAIDWTGEPTPFVGRLIDVVFEHVQAVVVLFSGDDKVRLREKLWDKDDTSKEKMFQPQPGPDQIFEAGCAFGKAPDHTILVQIGEVKLFTDIEGRYIPNFTGSKSDRNDLKNRLKRAGCKVENTGDAWLKAGDFYRALNQSPPFHT